MESNQKISSQNNENPNIPSRKPKRKAIKTNWKNKTFKTNVYSSIFHGDYLKKNDFQINSNAFEENINFINEYYKLNDLKDKSNEMIYSLNKFYKEFKQRRKPLLKNKIFFNNTELINIINNSKGKFISIKKIREEYLKKHNITSFSKSTLRRYLINQLGYIFKNVNIINKRALIVENSYYCYAFVNKFKEISNNDHIICYLDEASFNEHPKRKKLWYSNFYPFNVVNNGRINSISLMLLITKDQILHYELSENTNNSSNFINFIVEFENYLSNNSKHKDKYEQKKITIILDNSRIHICKSIIKELLKFKTNFLFLPPYQPTMNAVEYVFSFLKKKALNNVFNNL